jgi:3-ketosteroid 9alpha-monooxygenase subunit A
VGRYDFEGFARGWFVVSFSDELEPGEAKPLTYFGKELVLFRTASGEPKVLDAHCPHMGAHLGHGGKVEGDSIRCPFHAWSFDGDGECVEIPYAKKIPKRAQIPCWPVRERNGMIYVWHDREKGAPDWEIPILDGHGGDEWTPWNYGKVRIKTHPREIVENVVDVGHFIPVHGTHVSEISNEFDRHMATQINSGIAYPLGGGKDRYSLRATYHGPAYQVTKMEGLLSSRLINAHTPVGPYELDLRFAVSLKRDGSGREDSFIEQYVENLRGGFFQDIEIWENMQFRDAPILCDGDGAIIKLRRWYGQFYEPRNEAEAAHA